MLNRAQHLTEKAQMLNEVIRDRDANNYMYCNIKNMEQRHTNMRYNAIPQLQQQAER